MSPPFISSRKANGTRSTIAFDFDGVLAKHAPCPPVENPNPPVAGALQFIEWLIKCDYEVLVCSSRARFVGGVTGIQNWLAKFGFPALLVTGEKVCADLYIDDRALRFDGSWEKMYVFLHNNPVPSRWEKQ